MSKGSSPRPFDVDHETFSNNYDAIFGKKKTSQTLEELDFTFDELYKQRTDEFVKNNDTMKSN